MAAAESIRASFQAKTMATTNTLIVSSTQVNAGSRIVGNSETQTVMLRVLDANGAGSDSEVIAAIQQAIALKNTYNIRVIKLSLGRGIFAG